MREISYQNFSLAQHQKNWHTGRPNQCQFELTFRCAIKCGYCYTDCYNKPEYTRQELSTDQIKLILDKVHEAGVVWLCFTGGDPMVRRDFPELYAYAAKKGFILTVFTSGCHVTDEILNVLIKHKPLNIEMTLMGITRDTYERISQVKGSFDRALDGIARIRKAGLPLKIKTIVTKDNLHEVEEIRKFASSAGAQFMQTTSIHARLDGDTAPVAMRISPEENIALKNQRRMVQENSLWEDSQQEPISDEVDARASASSSSEKLYACTVGSGDGFHIDPYGNLFLCNLIRTDKVSLLHGEIESALAYLNPLFTEREFHKDSPCKKCELRHMCSSCPGKAHVETGDPESAIPDYCRYTFAMNDFLEKQKKIRNGTRTST